MSELIKYLTNKKNEEQLQIGDQNIIELSPHNIQQRLLEQSGWERKQKEPHHIDAYNIHTDQLRNLRVGQLGLPAEIPTTGIFINTNINIIINIYKI